jgi:hydroxymethylglutaryl-CoA synthase
LINECKADVPECPYGKQGQKDLGRLFYNDFLANPSSSYFAIVTNPEFIHATSYTASLTDKNLKKTFIGVSDA